MRSPRLWFAFAVVATVAAIAVADYKDDDLALVAGWSLYAVAAVAYIVDAAKLDRT